MHKRLLNEAVLELIIEPRGPILIKAGEKGADPTLPDMEFVRTNGAPYLPGSSLKGVIRSHCERLARTVHGPLACDPLDQRASCGARLSDLSNRSVNTTEFHKRSCFICRIFGNTGLASRFHISDAHADGDIRTEERNGVAIDRVYGSVAHGPFNYETVTEARFRTRIQLRNFGVAQVGLVALALRDIQQQRVRIGFAKSRGLGTVGLTVESLIVRYPACELTPGGLALPGGRLTSTTNELLGVGAFDGGDGYDFAPDDRVPLPEGADYRPDAWGEPQLSVSDPGQITALFRSCVTSWRAEAERRMQR